MLRNCVLCYITLPLAFSLPGASPFRDCLVLAMQRLQILGWSSSSQFPELCAKVTPTDHVLRFPDDGGEVLESFHDERARDELAEKKILCWQSHVHLTQLESHFNSWTCAGEVRLYDLGTWRVCSLCNPRYKDWGESGRSFIGIGQTPGR